jgi:hypothetical protein
MKLSWNIKLTLSELDHVICALEMVKENGEYYGNREQFWKRHERVSEIFLKQRDSKAKKTT